MRQPLQINFRDIPQSDAVEARVREKAEKLDRFYDKIMTCSVMVEAPHGHHHKGNLYHVRIDLTVPNGEIVINRDPKDNHAHEDVYVAIRDAFDAARRKLQDYARKQRGDVKKHELPPQDTTSELDTAEELDNI
jgi:ribosomal subunit interface protein